MGDTQRHIIGKEHVHCVRAYCGILRAIGTNLFQELALVVKVAVGIEVDVCTEVTVLETTAATIIVLNGEACTLWHIYNLWYGVEDLSGCSCCFQYFLGLAV